MTLSDFLKSRLFLGIVFGLAGAAVLLGTFHAGVRAGYHRAQFSSAWGEQYHRNFGGPRGGFLPELRMRPMGGPGRGAELPNPNGTFGNVIAVGEDTLTVVSEQGAEQVVRFDASTVIKKLDAAVRGSDIAAGDRVVVIGAPTESGQIQAKLIRIMPPLPAQGIMR